MPPIHRNADTILEIGGKYFPKLADSGQNKHLGIGVQTALKESHLSQKKKKLWEKEVKKEMVVTRFLSGKSMT